MSALALIARILEYPEDTGLLAHLDEAASEIDAADLAPAAREGLEHFLAWVRLTDPIVVQESYVESVDRSRRGSLHLFEHVHGESRERGAAMIDLRQFYAERGFEMAASELPDYLPVVLEFASRAPEAERMRFLAEIVPVVARIHAFHARQGSPWEPVLAAALVASGGTLELSRAQVPDNTPEPSIDELWAEPEVVFSGDCSTPAGDAK
ncbi:MAG: nitrate reductase molybdenum cofactor assembly chaperone [Fibrobacterota bacterium]|nr:MAG: nitrate reductase molybdenum cofactor assembly chaperone [Fibrobacterota bacterium]